tara:strand:- start:177 stop:509 length:333 start_codon:yes stop_codon:yes gene_type:complete
MSDGFYEMFVKQTTHLTINVSNIMTFVKYAMEIIELSHLKGPQQKDAVLKLLTTFITNTNTINDDTRQTLLNLIQNGTVANTIELVVEASKGNLNINQEHLTAISKCCGC